MEAKDRQKKANEKEEEEEIEKTDKQGSSDDRANSSRLKGPELNNCSGFNETCFNES